LLAEISAKAKLTNKSITIKPDSFSRAIGGQPDATTNVEGHTAEEAALVAADAHAFGTSSGAASFWSKIGTGRGVNPVIYYSPEMYVGNSKPPGPGNDPDEVLYHELMHASRYVAGIERNQPVNQGYENLKEYMAIVITNIYLSNKNRTEFVGDHNNGTLKDPEHFLDNTQGVDLPPRNLVELFRLDHPAFYRQLSWVSQARFNPVAQYENERSPFRVRK
jgi:Effector protein